MGRLEGKVAVVTGAASGIGRGTVELFAAEGCKVIAADIQDDKGARLEEDHKGAVRYVRCDVSRETDIEAAIKTSSPMIGQVDIEWSKLSATRPTPSASAATPWWSARRWWSTPAASNSPPT